MQLNPSKSTLFRLSMALTVVALVFDAFVPANYGYSMIYALIPLCSLPWADTALLRRIVLVAATAALVSIAWSSIESESNVSTWLNRGLVLCSLGLTFFMGRRYIQRRESVSAVREAVVNSDEPLIVADSDGRVVHWSRGAQLLTGRSVQHMEGGFISQLWSSMRQPDMRRVSDAARLASVCTAFETQILHANGNSVPVEISIVPIGRTVGWNESVLVLLRDLRPMRAEAQRRQDQQEALRRMLEDVDQLRQNAQDGERRFRLAIEAAPTGMIIVDKRGKIVLANAEISKLLGYSESELIGKMVEDLLPDKYRARHVTSRQEYAENSTKRMMGAGRDLFAKHKDGREIAVEIGLNPFHNADGDFVIGSVADITERQRQARHAEELAAARAAAAVERRKSTELETAYIELKQTQQRLVDSERLAVLGQLSGMMAHEIRNPFNAIRSSTYFLRSKLAHSDAKIDKHLDIIDRGIVTSNQIISNILDFARTKTPQHQPCDINQLIRELIASQAWPEKIKVVLDLDETMTAILVDPVQFNQVISNIVINGVQAMDGDGTLLVRTTVESANIKIEIADDGCGISPENLPNIFRPIFSTKPKGTGLGLAICQNVVRNHGGSIEVRSEVGNGTCFVLYFPKGVPAQQEARV